MEKWTQQFSEMGSRNKKTGKLNHTLLLEHIIMELILLNVAAQLRIIDRILKPVSI